MLQLVAAAEGWVTTEGAEPAAHLMREVNPLHPHEAPTIVRA